MKKPKLASLSQVSGVANHKNSAKFRLLEILWGVSWSFEVSSIPSLALRIRFYAFAELYIRIVRAHKYELSDICFISRSPMSFPLLLSSIVRVVGQFLGQRHAAPARGVYVK